MEERPKQKILSKAKEHVEYFLYDLWEERLAPKIGDSPIEKILICALLMKIEFEHLEFTGALVAPRAVSFETFDPTAQVRADVMVGDTTGPASCPLFVEHQVTVEGYRVDFRLGAMATKEVWTLEKPIIIECDGHNYHERTKEQAARDRSRDRALTNAGYSVLRFTGSEIFNDPTRCVDEIYDLLISRFFFS